MSDEVKPSPNEARTYDAQLAAEQITNGEKKAPKVNFEADCQAAQEFSVSKIDRTNEGVAAAEAATKPKYDIPETQTTNTEAQSTGNPDDYIKMANEIKSSKNETITTVNDDLLEKALKKGQPKK